MTTRRVLAAAFVSLLAGVASAQSLYVIDGTGPLYTEIVGRFPEPECLYPNGPVLGTWEVTPAPGCVDEVGIFPFGALLGDIAVDKVEDVVYFTDGLAIAVVDARSGTPLHVMSATSLPVGPLTGLGFDSAGGVLWVTDGELVLAVAPSAPGSCLPPTPLGAPFALQFEFDTIGDLDWDPTTGRLFLGDASGRAAAAFPGGALAIEPYLVGTPAQGACPIGPITGLAVDTSTEPVTLFVTDGFIITHELVGGGLAPPTFAMPSSCFPMPLPRSDGLAYASRPITYGDATAPAGLTPPTIDAVGQAVLPNPDFALTLADAPPGTSAWLVAGPDAACPAPTFSGAPFYVTSPITIVGPITVGVDGTVVLEAPLRAPGRLPLGASVFAQWWVLDGAAWRASEGLQFTLARP